MIQLGLHLALVLSLILPLQGMALQAYAAGMSPLKGSTLKAPVREALANEASAAKGPSFLDRQLAQTPAPQRQAEDYTYPILYQMDKFVDEYNAIYAPVPLGSYVFDSMMQQIKALGSASLAANEYLENLEKIKVFEVERLDHNKIWADNVQAVELEQKAQALAAAFFKYKPADINFMMIYLMNEYLDQPTRMDGWLQILNALQQHKFSTEQLQQYAKQGTKTYQWTQGFEYTSFGALLIGSLLVSRGRIGKAYKHLTQAFKGTKNTPLPSPASSKTSPAPLAPSKTDHNVVDEAVDRNFKQAQAQLENKARRQQQAAQKALNNTSHKSLKQKIRSSSLGPNIKNMLALTGLGVAGGFANLGFQQIYKKATGQEWSLRHLPLNPMQYKQNYADALATLSLECRAYDLWQQSQKLKAEGLVSRGATTELMAFGKKWNQLFLEKHVRLQANPYYLQKRALPQGVLVSSAGKVDFDLNEHSYSFECPMLKASKNTSAPYFTSIEGTLRYLYQSRQQVEAKLMAAQKMRKNRIPAQSSPHLQHIFMRSLAQKLSYLLNINHASINSTYQCLKAARANTWQVRDLKQLVSHKKTSARRATRQAYASSLDNTASSTAPPLLLNKNECLKKISILLSNIQIAHQIIKQNIALQGLMKPSAVAHYLKQIQYHMGQAIHQTHGWFPEISCHHQGPHGPWYPGALSSGPVASPIPLPGCDVWRFVQLKHSSPVAPLQLDQINFNTPLGTHEPFQGLNHLHYSPHYIENTFFSSQHTHLSLATQLKNMCTRISNEWLFNKSSSFYDSLIPEREFNLALKKIISKTQALAPSSKPNLNAAPATNTASLEHNTWAPKLLCPYFENLKFNSSKKEFYFQHQTLKPQEQVKLYLAASFLREYLSHDVIYQPDTDAYYGFKKQEKKLIEFISRKPYVAMLPIDQVNFIIMNNKLQQNEHHNLHSPAQNLLQQQGLYPNLILTAEPETLKHLEQLFETLLQHSQEKKQEHTRTLALMSELEEGDWASWGSFFKRGQVLKMFQHEAVVDDLVNRPTQELRHLIDDMSSLEQTKQTFSSAHAKHESIVLGSLIAGLVAVNVSCSFVKVPQVLIRSAKAAMGVTRWASRLHLLTSSVSKLRHRLPQVLKQVSSEIILCVNFVNIPIDIAFYQQSSLAYKHALRDFTLSQSGHRQALADLEQVNSAYTGHLIELLMLPLATPWVVQPMWQSFKRKTLMASHATSRGKDFLKHAINQIENKDFFKQWKDFRQRKFAQP